MRGWACRTRRSTGASGNGAGRRPCARARRSWRAGRRTLYLLAEVGDLRPGLALDAGCGHGSEAIWLATSGWRVTAVDFSATALDYGRSTADAVGADIAERIEWVEGDLGSWTPPPGRFDLVSCLYVHVAGSVVEMVRRLGAGVAPGGTLLLVGHRRRTRRPAPPRPRPARCRCRWTRRSRLSTRTSGRSSSRRNGHELRSAAVSTRWSARSGAASCCSSRLVKPSGPWTRCSGSETVES